MKKFIALALAATAFSLSADAQAKKPQPKTKGPAANFKKSGAVTYAIIKDVPGPNVTVGDMIEAQITVKIGDSVLSSTMRDNGGKPAQLPIQQTQSPIEWAGPLTNFSVGDSGLIRVAVDSIKKYSNGQELPGFMKPGKFITFEINVTGMKTKEVLMQEQAVRMKEQEEMMKKAEANAAVQKETDDKLLQEYFKINKITPTKTASGLYYSIKTKGAGKTPATGNLVNMNYTGMLMNGEKFDSNVDPAFNHVQPFEFPLGQGRVIKGWDEGIALLPKGTKATLYIPSGLAYGANAAGPKIPANSVLIFDVEVVDVKE